ncbi:MAG: tripartite tricarboxylate transporter substrate binding protein [Betaproteobacteria bacterium]|nr:tripartite tricarboxylate transporter substrate binding protein [Betaproteobacteria bacterium]
MRIESGRSTGYSALFITGRLALLLVAAAATAVDGYGAAPPWKPEKPVEFIVPDSPGGGQDRTVRFIQKFMQDGGVLTTPVNIVNRPGGSGNLAYTYLSQFTGDGHYLAIATATLLTNHILGLSPFSYADFTPAGVLYGEHIGFAVSAGGPIKSGRDLIERVRKNPESVSFAFGTSRGNANHIAVALVMKAAGVDVSKLKVVIYKASIDATTALMGGHVDVVATPASTFVPVIASGKVRVIAIAAPRRTTGQLASVPTWQEQGLNVVASGYRMFIAPKGLNAGHIAFWDNALTRLSRSEAWRKELEANEWQDSYMNSADSRKYLDARYEEYRGILVELGLAKK